MADKVIEYFYSAHSAFAYLGARKLSEIANAQGYKIHHRPMDFWPVVKAANQHHSGKRSAAHMDYFFGREIARWGEWRGLPIMQGRPTFHDNALALASGLIIAAQNISADVDALSFEIVQSHWANDTDIADPATLHQIATARGLDADALLETAMSDAVQSEYAANTAEAISRDVFGSPTYFVAGDKFYGQDRLEMVERALSRPFA
jgi:2-hydroxychromene-2-carboxylate isomerase